MVCPHLSLSEDSAYVDYLHVKTLLSLQKEPSERVDPDELLFQSIHQAFEIWCKVIIEDMPRVHQAFEQDQAIVALPLLQRATRILQNQTEAMGILDTLEPKQFHAIRRVLSDGSGSESPGFRALLLEGNHLSPIVDAWLQRQNHDAHSVMELPGGNTTRIVVNALLDLDQALQGWRHRHVTTVLRQLGLGVKSLKGAPVEKMIEAVNDYRFLPVLWQGPTWLTDKEGTSPA